MLTLTFDFLEPIQAYFQNQYNVDSLGFESVQWERINCVYQSEGIQNWSLFFEQDRIGKNIFGVFADEEFSNLH